MARIYQVQPGDTLSGIAQKLYGDATLFGLIATVNSLPDDPNVIVAGLRENLWIPQLPAHWDVRQGSQVFGSQVNDQPQDISLQIPCMVPDGMQLVIDNVSGRLWALPDILVTPFAFGAPYPPDNDHDFFPEGATLAFFPWIRAFDAVDAQNNPAQRWSAFNCATKIYVDGPAEYVTFTAQAWKESGSQDEDTSCWGHISFSGHLEALPPDVPIIIKVP